MNVIETTLALLGKKARVERIVVDALPPERSGKLQLVKSSTYEDFRPTPVAQAAE